MTDLFERCATRHIPTGAQIARAEASLGISFPASYTGFCLRYGSGLIGGLFAIYVPREDAADEASMTRRARTLRERLEASRSFWRDEGMVIGVDVWEGAADPEMVERAVFIGQSFDGHEIFWDVSGAGEYPIFVENKSTVRFGGNTLDEFIRRCQGDEVRQVFGPGYEPLPSVFEGRD